MEILMANGQPASHPLYRRSALDASMLPDERDIERFLAQCHRRRYPNRADVFRPGDPGGTLYYVIRGSLSVMSEEEDGRELILDYVHEGELIGETGIFIEAPERLVILRTRGVCELAEIGHARLLALFHGPLADICPKMLYLIGSQLTKRLLHTHRKVRRLAFMDVRHRIESTLADLTREPDALPHPDGTQIRISRQDLSRIVGCSREMAGRVLKQLQIEERLHARGKTIVIFHDAILDPNN